MKMYKKLMLMSMGILFLGFQGLAQVDTEPQAEPSPMQAKTEKTPEQRLDNQMERISKYLDLDDAQAEQVRPILKEQMEARQAASQDAKENSKVAKEETNTKMKAILTEAQYSKYLEGMEKRKMKRQKRKKRAKRKMKKEKIKE